MQFNKPIIPSSEMEVKRICYQREDGSIQELEIPENHLQAAIIKLQAHLVQQYPGDYLLHECLLPNLITFYNFEKFKKERS